MDKGSNTAKKMKADPVEDQAELAWAELGYKIRPLFAKVFVRTEPPQEKIGLIWLPPKAAGFYGGMAHQRITVGTVIAKGPLARGVQVGDRIAFVRLFFAYIKKLEGGRHIGWIEQEQTLGTVEGENDGLHPRWA